jgi:group I intron endonuclease
MIPITPDGRSIRHFTPSCGIYAIVHTPTGRRYIGSSCEIEKRLYYHVVMLRKGRHHCDYLQNVWNKHGEQQFGLFLLEICSIECLAEREQHYMDQTVTGLRMNSQPIAKTARGYHHSEETKEAMSLAAMEVAEQPGERERRSQRAKLQHAQGKLGRQTWRR